MWTWQETLYDKILILLDEKWSVRTLKILKWSCESVFFTYKMWWDDLQQKSPCFFAELMLMISGVWQKQKGLESFQRSLYRHLHHSAPVENNTTHFTLSHITDIHMFGLFGVFRFVSASSPCTDYFFFRKPSPPQKKLFPEITCNFTLTVSTVYSSL